MTDTTPLPATPTDRITMFGADWCSDCRRTKGLLESLSIDYDYVDVEASADAAERSRAISGRTNIPVVTFPDSTFQVEPSNADLEAKLRELGRL